VRLGRRLWFALAALAVSAGVLAGVAEVAVLVLRPTPRVQVVRRSEVVSLDDIHGVPVWRSRWPEVAAHGCDDAPASAFRVLMVGSSILRGSGVEGHETVTTLLQARFPAAEVCVDNVSEPAFTAPQKRMAALARIRDAPPDLVIFEVWHNDDGTWVLLGDDAISVGALRVGSDGLPTLGPTGSAHRALLRGSALYRFLTLTLAEDPARQRDLGARWARMLPREVGPVVEAARAVGADVELWVMPPLDRSFRASLAAPGADYGAVWAWAEAEGVPWVRVAELFGDRDPEAVRVDPCCHYNAAGHAVLADAMAAAIARWRLRRGHDVSGSSPP
jgi:hypothetical protein